MKTNKKFDGKKFVESLLNNCEKAKLKTHYGYEIDGYIAKITTKLGEGIYQFPEGTTKENFPYYYQYSENGKDKKILKCNTPKTMMNNNNHYQDILKKWLEIPRKIRKQLIPYIETYTKNWESMPFSYSNVKCNFPEKVKKEMDDAINGYQKILRENGYAYRRPISQYFFRTPQSDTGYHIEITESREIYDLIKQFS